MLGFVFVLIVVCYLLVFGCLFWWSVGYFAWICCGCDFLARLLF